MLSLFGKPKRYCDGLTRRSFLKIGALGMGGVALPQILRAESASGLKRSHKSIIMIYLPGGPPHQDTFDLKLGARVAFAVTLEGASVFLLEIERFEQTTGCHHAEGLLVKRVEAAHQTAGIGIATKRVETLEQGSTIGEPFEGESVEDHVRLAVAFRTEGSM